MSDVATASHPEAGTSPEQKPPPPDSSASAPSSRRGSPRNAPLRRSELATEQGKTSIADAVVAKIAGIACREVAGVHDMGGGAARAMGAIKEMLPIGSDSPSPTRGVSVEVGERQSAVDLDVVVDYGAAIVDVAASIRDNVIERVESMTGLEVTEVNVTVDDVYLGEDEGNSNGNESRVR